MGVHGIVGRMGRPRDRALLLAALQAVDFVVTRYSPAYGDAHLDNLRIPKWLRPALPFIKVAAVVALVASSNSAPKQRAVGIGMVTYSASAATFHIAANDSTVNTAPAVACGLLAASIV
jgi:branched-subunit amino acid transport protein